MSHAVPNNARVKKRDGTLTTNMAQTLANNYLRGLLNASHHANLSQCLNDVFSGKGKATGAYQQDGNPVFHASSGNQQKSVTLFYYVNGGVATLFAMGEHKSSTSYLVSHYGQPNGPFTQNATIALS